MGISLVVHLLSFKTDLMVQRTLIVTGLIIKWVLAWPQISIRQLVMKLSSGLVMNTFSIFKKSKMLSLLIWDVLMAKQHLSNMVISKLVMNDLDISSELLMNSLMMNVVLKLVIPLLDLTLVIKVMDKLIDKRQNMLV